MVSPPSRVNVEYDWNERSLTIVVMVSEIALRAMRYEIISRLTRCVSFHELVVSVHVP